MKKIIVNIVLAILELMVLFAVIYGGELTSWLDAWEKLLVAILALVSFGTDSAIIISYLDPEEEDDF